MARRAFSKARFTCGLTLCLLALRCNEPSHSSSSPSLSPPEVTIRRTETRRLRSAIVGQDYEIQVSLPSPLESGKKYPTVYVLDGNWIFGTVTETSRLLASGGEIPPVLVVGIGYADASAASVRALRARDDTPTPDPDFVRSLRERVPDLPENATTGGAPAFLRFLKEELIPFVEAQYPADPQDRTLLGHSFGGLFTLYTLFERPETFHRYIAGSPSLWWGRGTIFEDEAALAESRTDLPVKLFLSAGALEESPDNPRSAEAAMVSNLRRLEAVMKSRSYAGLDLTTVFLPDETHLSAIPATISRGLRAVF
jgi:predicted alpha/beta superfamily hydrolase